MNNLDNNPSDNSDFEKLMRQQLNQVDASPDDHIWEQIAAQQSLKNPWLRMRYYGAIATPILALCLLAALAWWHFSPPGARAPETGPVAAVSETAIDRHSDNTLHAGAPEGIVQTEPTPNESAVTLPERYLVEPVAAAATHRFSSRINTVPGTAQRFMAETGLDYESPVSGTRVHIPANVLVHADGRPVRGEVTLEFREYRSIPDFLASGIPMHYADERGSFFFNSGGMFEVRTYQGGEELQLGPDESYDVVFSPTNRLARASLYYYDEEKNNWVYRPDPAFGNLNEQNQLSQAPTVSEAQAIRDNTGGQRAECMPLTAEMSPKDPVKMLKQGVQVGYDLAFGKTAIPKWFLNNSHLNNEQLLNSLEKGLVRIVRDRDRLDQFFPEDIDNVFTELKAFKDCYFFRDVDSSTSLRKLMADSYWQRISISKDKGNTCQIWLYGEKGLVQLYADLTGSAGNENFNFDKVMNEYLRLREERQHNFEMMVAGLRAFLYSATVFQTEQEWCMDSYTWLNYFQNNLPLMRKRYDALVKAGMTTDDALIASTWKAWNNRVRNLNFDKLEQNAQVRSGYKKNLEYALRVSRFGLYNCDQIFRLGNDYIYAAYETADGKRVVPASVSVLERSTRLFFTLPATAQMLRLNGRRMAIVVTDREGRTYLVPDEKYAALDLKNCNSNKFVVNDVTDKAQTPRDWANLLEL